MPVLTDNFYKRDFWIEENLVYAQPIFRSKRCARMIAKFAIGEQCDLLDVGCGPASLRRVLPPNVNYHGIDIAIHEPAPYLRELDFSERPIGFNDKRFRFVVALGVLEYMGRRQREKFSEIANILEPNGKFIMSYVNFRHIRKKIYAMYNNVQTIEEMRRGLEEVFRVEQIFPVCHHWRHKQPGRNALPALQMKIDSDIPVFSRLFAVEYFFVCSKRA